jgi:hypothetical protein
VNLNEKYAWPARIIYELLLYTKFVLSDENNFLSFSKQVLIDEKELIEGIESLFKEEEKTPSMRASKQSIQKRLEDYKGIRNLPRNYKEIADDVGLSKDYTAFYKLFSKFVHPSPWLLMGNEEFVHNKSFRKNILMTAEKNSLEILNSVRRVIND